MTINKARAVVTALLMIKEDGPRSPTCGICLNVDRNIHSFDVEEEERDEIESYWEDNKPAAFKAWPSAYNTGSTVYPVPQTLYVDSYDSMWLSGVAADARRDLLDCLITHFTKLAQDIT